MCENLYSTNQATMSDVIVTTGSGKVKGVTRRAKIDPYDYYAFFGIPYAEPPTGELRFRASNLRTNSLNIFEFFYKEFDSIFCKKSIFFNFFSTSGPNCRQNLVRCTGCDRSRTVLRPA